MKLKIASRDGREELLSAPADEVLSIVNVLDQVFTSAPCRSSKQCSSASQILTEPGLHNEQRIRCSVTLQKLCGAFGLLPDSHVISDGLELTNPLPVACGGFADVYQGIYRGCPVAIKTLRLPDVEEQELARLKKARPFFQVSYLKLTFRTRFYSHYIKKRQAGNIWTIPTSSLFSVPRSNRIPSRLYHSGWKTATLIIISEVIPRQTA
jgi:hypothetical protein